MTKKKATEPRHEPAAKKTGKRGPRPLDPKEDFGTPTVKVTTTEQAELLPTAKAPAPAIQHGKMAVHFVRFVPDRAKDREQVVSLDFSLELEDVHLGKLPQEIEDAWKDLRHGSIKRIDPDGIKTQNLKISIVPDGDVDLEVVAAVNKVTISRITSKGKGKERKVTRLQMRFLTNFTKDVAEFCRNNYDETMWITMKASQRSFGDEKTE